MLHPSMNHLALVGGSERLLTLAGHLQASGLTVTLVPHDPVDALVRTVTAGTSAPSLAVVELGPTSAPVVEVLAATSAEREVPWLALCPLGEGSQAEGPLGESPLGESSQAGGSQAEGSQADAQGDAGRLTTEAYRAGARAVLPPDAPTELVVRTVERTLESLAPRRREQVEPLRRRQYRTGDRIALHAEQLLRVVDGVVAQVTWHEDGTEGLVGLWGPGNLLSGHPDEDSLSLRAHTDALVEVGTATGEDACELLLTRVRRLEAWSCAQSRQSTEQRLLGVLELLAEQFGQSCNEGVLIDVRVTHAQLAAAIGATRATVTRLLGPLRRRGVVSTVSSSAGERFCLPPRWPGTGGTLAQSMLLSRC